MLQPRLLARLQQKKAQLDALRPLPEAAVRRLNDQLAVEWTYNTNAIEGNTLTLRETQLILETGLTIGGRSLREHLEVINHRQAIGYIETLTAQTEPVSAHHVRQIQRLILARIDDETAGQYRRLPVRIAGSRHQPAEAGEVPHLMERWEKWRGESGQTLPAIERTALAHYRLVAIHPFLDGNGRTARLVMNLLLMKEGYPPTIILRVNRRQYYNILAQADAGREAPLVNSVGRAVERSLTLYLEACPPTLEPPNPDDRWLPLREQPLQPGLSQSTGSNRSSGSDQTRANLVHHPAGGQGLSTIPQKQEPVSYPPLKAGGLPASTAPSRRVEAVDLLTEAASPCRLVAQLPAKLPPTRITDRLSQLVVFEHLGHVQILDLEVAELPGEAAAYLMQEVFTLIGYPFGPDSQPLSGLFFAFTAFFATGHNPLRSLQAALGLSEGVGLVYFFAQR